MACRIVEGLTHIAKCIRVRFSDHVSGLMTGIKDLPMRLPSNLVQTVLEPFRPPAPMCLFREFRAQAPDGLVPIPDNRLDATPGDEHGILTIRRGDESIHTEVHADSRLRWTNFVWHLTHQLQLTIGEPRFHQPPRQGDWERDQERTRIPTWEPQTIPFHGRTLVCENDVAIAAVAPGIQSVLITVLPKLPSRLHGFAEVSNYLLHRLRVHGGKLSLGPLLQALFRRPAAVV